MKKTALVLSGGGFKGAFQLGALRYLRDNWSKINPDTEPLTFDIVAGVSVGSLNGLLIASRKFDELENLWAQVAKNGGAEIFSSDFIDNRPEPGNLDAKLKIKITWDTVKKHFPATTRNILLKAIFNKDAILKAFSSELANFKALADNSPLAQKLTKLAIRDQIKDCTFKCGYVSLNSGNYISVDHSDFLSDKDFANGVLASTTMPIVWKPIAQIATKQGIEKYAVDGGIRDVSPLGEVIRQIAGEKNEEEYTIVIINCSSGEILPEDYEKKNIAQIALRSLNDIAITEIFNNDLKEFIDKNFILEQILKKYPGEVLLDYDYKNKKPGKPLRYFSSIIINPDEEELGDTLIANDVWIQKRIDHGLEKARLALEEHSGKYQENKSTVV